MDSDKKPLVVESGQLQQLQPGQKLDIPLQESFEKLLRQHVKLVAALVELGIELPEDIVEYAASAADDFDDLDDDDGEEAEEEIA